MNAELKEQIAKAMHASVIGDLFGRTESQLLAGIAISAIEAAGYVVVQSGLLDGLENHARAVIAAADKWDEEHGPSIPCTEEQAQ